MCKEKCHKGKNPKECTPKQIKECHGDTEVHPCEENADCESGSDKAEKKSDK